MSGHWMGPWVGSKGLRPLSEQGWRQVPEVFQEVQSRFSSADLALEA